MKRPLEEEAGRWLEQAEIDLEDAELLMREKRYHLVCFLCQQAAEKAAKAILYMQGEENPWGHSVYELLEEAAMRDSTLHQLADKGAVLDKYYIPTRYPNGLPGGIPAKAFDREDAERALELAKEIVRTVAERRDRLASSHRT